MRLILALQFVAGLTMTGLGLFLSLVLPGFRGRVASEATMLGVILIAISAGAIAVIKRWERLQAAQTVYHHRTTDPGIEFHCEHPSSPSMPAMDIEEA